MLYFSILFFLMTPDRAWEAMAKENQMLASRLQYEVTLKENPQNDLANIGWFLTFTGQGPTVELLEAMKTVLGRVPEGAPAAEFVLVWMQAVREYIPDFEESIAEYLLSPVDHRIDNGSYLILKNQHLRQLAKLRGDESLYERAISEAQTLNKWLFAPRVGQYAIPDFHKKWPNLDWQSATEVHSLTGTVVPPPQVNGPGILYAVTQFQTAKKQQMRLRFFSYQNAVLFLNGKTLYTHKLREDMGPAIVSFSFQAPSGTNELTVKTTQTSKRNGHFQIQLDSESELTVLEPTAPKYRLSDEHIPIEFETTGLEHFLMDLEGTELATSGLCRFLKSLTYLRKKDYEPALNLLEELFEEYPNSQIIGGQLVHLYLDGLPFLPEDRQIGKAYAALERLYQSGQMFPENKLLLASILIQARQTKDAVFLLRELIEENPGYCGALELLLALSEQEKLLDIKTEITQKLQLLGEDHPWAQKTLLKQAKREGDMEEIKRLLANLKELYPWGPYESEYFERNNQYLKAIESLQKHMKYSPESTYYPYTISKYHRMRSSYQEQYQWLEKTLAKDPTHHWSLKDIVNIDLYHGKKEQAMKRLDNYLALVPHDATFRQMRSHLQGETYFEPYRVDTSEVIAEAAGKARSIGADSELLLDQMMVRIFPDGSQMRYIHLVTRVLTKKGVDRESEVQLPPYAEILELRTIKQDGSIYYPEDIQNKNTISLSSLSVGDFIDEEHIEYVPPAFYDQDGLDGNMSFIFQGVDRIYHHSECVLIYPEGLDLQFLEKNFPGEVEKTTRNGLVYARWLTKDMPPLIPEPAMPNPGQIMPKISFTYQTDWHEIRDFFMHITATKMKPSQALKAKAREWVEMYPDPRERAQFMYREICDAIEPENQFYRNINLTWDLKAGNATLLLTALYNLADLPANLVFSRTRAFENTILDAPYPDLFFRAFIQLHLPDETLLLDANRKYLKFGHISPDFFGAKALILDPKREPVDFIPVQGPQYEPVSASYRLVIQQDGSLFGWGEESFDGFLASKLYTRYQEMSQPERIKQVEAGVNERFPESRIKNVILDEEPKPGSFTISYDFDVENWTEIDSHTLEIPYPLPKSPLKEHYSSLATRNYPVEIKSPILNQAHLILHAPEGFKWDFDNRSFQLETEFGSYQLEISTNTDKELEIKRVYQLPYQQIGLEKYPDFQTFCQDILDAEQLTFKAVKN
ncbi:MAG: hypothetical protein CSA81_05630 [Acidobacteria bacterium]|nr:MAG: hypothetical protein CSA81_05630 [Acidobacteriota bacterium]